MARVLIVGYGNPLRGDDGMGWHAAEMLRQSVDDPEVEIITVHQLTPELMGPVSEAGSVIFLDAAASGEPGAVTQRRIDTGATPAGDFTHHVTPETLLEGARILYGRRPPATLLSVAGADFEPGDQLSEPVRGALPEVVRLALQLLNI